MPVKTSSHKNVISHLHSSVGHWFEPMTMTTFKNIFVFKLPSTPGKSGWRRTHTQRVCLKWQKTCPTAGAKPWAGPHPSRLWLSFSNHFTVGQCCRRARGLSMSCVKGSKEGTRKKTEWNEGREEEELEISLEDGKKWFIDFKCVFGLSPYMDTSVVKTNTDLYTSNPRTNPFPSLTTGDECNLLLCQDLIPESVNFGMTKRTMH